MSRVDAKPVVALVAQKHSLGNRPVGQYVCHAVRWFVSALKVESAVALVGARLPFPAIIRAALVNLCPKMGFNISRALNLIRAAGARTTAKALAWMFDCDNFLTAILTPASGVNANLLKAALCARCGPIKYRLAATRAFLAQAVVVLESVALNTDCRTGLRWPQMAQLAQVVFHRFTLKAQAPIQARLSRSHGESGPACGWNEKRALPCCDLDMHILHLKAAA